MLQRLDLSCCRRRSSSSILFLKKLKFSKLLVLNKAKIIIRAKITPIPRPTPIPNTIEVWAFPYFKEIILVTVWPNSLSEIWEKNVRTQLKERSLYTNLFIVVWILDSGTPQYQNLNRQNENR